MKITTFVSLSFSALTVATNAASILPFNSITGFSGGDSFTPQDFTPLTNGSGITKPDVNDPATWTNGGTSTAAATYQDEWYDNFLVGAANSKLGWVSFDLGSVQTQLVNLYLINADAQSNIVSGKPSIFTMLQCQQSRSQRLRVEIKQWTMTLQAEAGHSLVQPGV